MILDKKDILIGKHTHKSFKKIIKTLFSRYRVRVNVYVTYSYNDGVCLISMGGSYDECDDKIDIDFYVSEMPDDELIITLDFWKEFNFKLSQLMLHELIHRKQAQSREYLFEPRIYNVIQDVYGRREYFANSDEIDAYSHDIALEIIHFYKKRKKIEVFSKISKKKKLESFSYYRKAFGNTDWTKIYRKLMKKTYKWVEYYDF
jgi:hypothetical protein